VLHLWLNEAVISQGREHSLGQGGSPRGNWFPSLSQGGARGEVGLSGGSINPGGTGGLSGVRVGFCSSIPRCPLRASNGDCPAGGCEDEEGTGASLL